MPEALICPRCGAPLVAGSVSCGYCHVQFGNLSMPPAGEPPHARQEIPPLPQGWIQYINPWDGVALARPQGWQVSCTRGVVSVRKDPAGLCAALIQPLQLRQALSPGQVANQWLVEARKFLPGLQAWVVPASAADPSRLTLRLQAVVMNVAVMGNYCAVVQGQNAMVSGFLCPTQTVNREAETMQTILSSFRLVERLAREPIQETAEGACSAWIPRGWAGQLTVRRLTPGGPGQVNLDVRREPAGLAMAAQPLLMWNFQEGGMPIFGMPMTGQPMAYQPAAQLCHSFLTNWLRQYHPDLVVESIDDRPDFTPVMAMECARTGQNPQMLDLTGAVMTIKYTEGGVVLRERLRLLVYHPRSMLPGMAFMSGPTLWSAFLDSYIRAPVEEYETLEPLLSGVLDSMQVNPMWQQNELARTRGMIRNSQLDIQRRQRQISQTLSETSDIVNQGYWSRQEVYDDLSHKWSNAILETQDMTDSSGTVYNVPSGFDQYWRDGLDNIYGGGLLVNPDPTWTRLDPTGS